MTDYKNILCVTDFTPFSEKAVERAAKLAGLYNARLTLLHVIEHFPEDRSNEVIAPENADPAAYRKEHAHHLLTELANKYDCQSATLKVAVSTHSAGKPIVRFATEHDSDLIVIASHGHHGLAAILGSTANSVMHSAPCDVLAVRARG